MPLCRVWGGRRSVISRFITHAVFFGAARAAPEAADQSFA
ncbi:hypothetical protein BSIN_3660 [Burkholderia singularis]|uniref:Uncharacterized protein n=1 Tax=Burkholderia singularis TaxID=1503053 RepID=A0A238H5M9_9BURK|nr:hypothetical protein BSIN_3660 [Burkholderia singularis]